MKKIENRVSTQIRIDEKLYAKLKAIADIEHRYMNSQLEYFVEQGIRAYEAQHGPITVPKDQDET